MTYPQIWITDEPTPRVITVRGRSAIDPDVLVGNCEGVERPLWLVDDGAKTTGVYVCGLGGDVYARLIHPPEKPPQTSLLPAGRHEAWLHA